MQLVVVRHGESEWNKLNLFTGWRDVGLSEQGRVEASSCGATCRSPVVPSTVYRHILQVSPWQWPGGGGEGGAGVGMGEPSGRAPILAPAAGLAVSNRPCRRASR